MQVVQSRWGWRGMGGVMLRWIVRQSVSAVISLLVWCLVALRHVFLLISIGGFMTAGVQTGWQHTRSILEGIVFGCITVLVYRLRRSR